MKLDETQLLWLLFLPTPSNEAVGEIHSTA